ncbi:retrotransposon protein, putative, ty1-copia subclass [Tanacetum coccineum]
MEAKYQYLDKGWLEEKNSITNVEDTVFNLRVMNLLRYPKETVGYSFYNPSKNKVFVARNAEFFESNLIDQEASGSLKDLEIIQEEDTNPSLDTSLNHEEDDQEIDEPQSDINPIRRSTRIKHAPYRMCLYIDAEEHELGDLGKPANYKAALLDPESKKWLAAMNVEMQSMKDNDVWELVVFLLRPKLVDYEETFSPVVDIRAIRILIAIAAFYDYEIWQMDVKITFLNGHLFEEVYMTQPEGEAAYILGIKIYRDRSKRLIGLCQSAYIEKIFKRYSLENSKCGTIPMQEKLKLSKSDGASTPAEMRHMSNVPYASAVGSIMYANPGELHWTTVKNILKYLRITKDMFLVYGGNMEREVKVSCYTDAGYLTDADDLRYQTGYVFVLNGGDVDWKSTKQSIFATSSTDAEYIAAFDASKEAVWIRKFISGLNVAPTIEEPITMYCDNTRAIAIAKDHGVTKGARHFRAKVHYLRETVDLGDVRIEQIDTDDNLADPFTKALAFPKHSELTRKIGLIPARYTGCVRSARDLVIFGDPNKRQTVRRKVDIENLDGNITKFTMWDDMAQEYDRGLVEMMEGTMIINASSCRVS